MKRLCVAVMVTLVAGGAAWADCITFGEIEVLELEVISYDIEGVSANDSTPWSEGVFVEAVPAEGGVQLHVDGRIVHFEGAP